MPWRKTRPEVLQNSNNHTLFQCNLYIDIGIEVYALVRVEWHSLGLRISVSLLVSLASVELHSLGLGS